MFRFVLLIVALSSASVLAGTEEIPAVPLPNGRIVGGTAADIRQFPHQISMRYNGRHRCGGSIYSANIIVTATHCVTGVNVTLMTIVAGSTLLSENNVELPVLKIIMHENYRALNNDYDVSILVLRGRLLFNEYIQPIALAKERAPLGAEVTVTGWGTLVEGGSIPDQLQKVNVNVVDNVDCKNAYKLMLTSRMMCASVEAGGKDACQGDSGGPLIVGNELLGIVSWGSGCARENFPGVYASVPELREWIEKTAKMNVIEFA